MNISSDQCMAIEQLAVELATLAGAEIQAAMSRQLMVDYKGDPGAFRDPVSEVDRNVETLIRARLAERFPGHGVLGEEMEAEAAGDIIWAVDPVDGTNNFINGFPMFSASIGVLGQGRPIVGALWCSTSHLLRPGVYHGRPDGPLQFDGQPVVREVNPDVRRRLGGDPHGGSPKTPWDKRKTGSAALECAFVAAGLLQIARFERPFIWDVAGGIALARAAGRMVLTRDRQQWTDFDGFGAGGIARSWRQPILIGERSAVEVARSLYS
ncbi:MAG: inositol monophosphatase [Lautropia sp.]